MATKLDLADAQLIGYSHGKYQDLLGMVISMGLTKREWLKWKKKYTTSYITDDEMQEIDDYFGLTVMERVG